MPWILVIALFAAVSSRAWIIPKYVHNIGFSEQNVIDGILRLLDGRHLYGDPEQPPYDIMQYGPVHYYACAAIGHVLGLGEEEPQAAYILSRAVCLAANLGALWLLWGIGRHLRFSAWSRVLLMGLMFTWMHEPFFSRPDSVYQFFCTAIVALSLRTLDQGTVNWTQAMWAGLLSALAVFSKQSGAGFAAAMLLGFVIAGYWRVALRIGVMVLLFNVLFLGVVSGLDGLHNFYANVVLGNVNGFNWPWFALIPSEPYMGMAMWITPAALLAAWYLRRVKKDRATFLIVSMLVSYVWAFATASKVGSNLNYFMEHWLLCAITCLLFVENSTIQAPRIQVGLILALSAIVLLRGAWFTKVFMFSGYPPDERAQYLDDLQAVKDLRQHGLSDTDAVFVVRQYSFIDQALGEQAWLKHKDILHQSREKLPLDHSLVFDNNRNQQLRYVLTTDTTDVLGQDEEVFVDWCHTFNAGRYAVYERRP
jgi:hypothetical protein